MDNREILRLKFRRQYIIGSNSIDCPFDHIKFDINGTDYLYAHSDLVITELRNENLKLILLGDIFDFDSSNKGNLSILKEISKAGSDNICYNLSRYTGSFVLLAISNTELHLYHDATATKKIFYCNLKGRTWCASQPHLLAKILSLNSDLDSSRLLYYSSKEFTTLGNAGIGNTTYYKDIFQVLPNHYFNFSSKKIIRYWPNFLREEISVEECIEISTTLIKGYVESIAERYKTMLPVTSGKDSRTILAATKDMRNNVLYYVNKEKQLSLKSNDIKIPKKLFKMLDLDFYLLDIPETVDENFKKIYYENNFLASGYYLPIIYNYYLKFSDRVNLPGNIATGGIWNYPYYKRNVTVKTFQSLNKLVKYDHARDAYSDWLNRTNPIANESGYDIFDLFYWEERLGNWGTQIQQDKEIAQLEFSPFNSRLLVQTMLSIKNVYLLDSGNYSINKAIIKRLWPEILCVPINPTWRNSIVKLLDTFHLTEKFYQNWYR